ncbi:MULTISPECIES: hypothetical protein [unclassified Bacillus (in: firmicutes)]|uniref:hypothetical protein n=1 Tax=unclassified Bacillus (in: firmicutes) TaxID=185979 RepID=UPI000BF06290|nr:MULTISPECIES: hypothetical protein [unclassified Bacillus (in: firmicutes)]PEJ59047.1 hypothetical protein CN692_06095 [Bacillus sp. AFS002410]PEK99032.1 hypothetical protein CN601_24295 [Bacillus sp. AFS017336]
MYRDILHFVYGVFAGFCILKIMSNLVVKNNDHILFYLFCLLLIIVKERQKGGFLHGFSFKKKK